MNGAKRVTMRVNEDHDIHVITEWSGGHRTSQWVGFWRALGIMWGMLRQGIPVEFVE